MDGEIEILVSEEEFQELKRHKREFKPNLNNLEGLERTLRTLQYRYLTEKLTELRKKLEEMKEHYSSLIEFEKMAKEDKVYLMKKRAELSEENRRLEAKVRGYEGNH
ncbi:hypothetical protein [Thermococcus sp.]|uniref:hypothetical protein n=1 Tax=Thermococcus sp. TaxID=35749 RepID=UPI0026322211|nr:hypothetical protein [Thermococcus sp.]